jgi:hypothetical protein
LKAFVEKLGTSECQAICDDATVVLARVVLCPG